MRRLYIIAKRTELTQSVFEAAKMLNCPEIAQGIPPALAHIVKESELPYVYIEPEAPPPEPVRDYLAEIDTLRVDYSNLLTQISSYAATLNTLQGRMTDMEKPPA